MAVGAFPWLAATSLLARGEPAAHHGTGSTSVVLLLGGLAVVYLLACVVYPYRRCPRCKGDGKFSSPTRKSWNRCRRCRGEGTVTRLGRQLYDRLAGRE